MSAEERQEFTFIWKIKHFLRIHSTTFHAISSPLFAVEFLKDIKWNLVLIKESQKVFCYVNRRGCSEFPEHIIIDYQYELTTSDGIILKPSDTLSDALSIGQFTNRYELIDLDDRNTPEDVCLRCRMVIPCLTPSIKSSPCSVVGWKAETDIVCVPYSFKLSLTFSGIVEWTAVEKVRVENLTMDIAFKYTNDKLQIELFSKIEDNTYHSVVCTIGIVDEKSVLVKEYCGAFKFSKIRRIWHFPFCVNKQHLERVHCFILKKIHMIVHFDYQDHSFISEMRNLKGDFSTAALTQHKDEADNLSYLLQHLREMLKEKTYADVKLRADDEVFFAHKCLLANRSPVFKAMFDQDMLERKTNIIDIHDVEAKILKIFLEYLYTGTVDGLNGEIAMSLLIVADKYQVTLLPEECSTFLKSVLNLDNVLNVLKVADMVNQEQLKVFAVEYIVQNSSQVLSSPNWPQWVKMNTTLASEVLFKLSNKFDSSSKSNKV